LDKRSSHTKKKKKSSERVTRNSALQRGDGAAGREGVTQGTDYWVVFEEKARSRKKTEEQGDTIITRRRATPHQTRKRLVIKKRTCHKQSGIDE